MAQNFRVWRRGGLGAGGEATTGVELVAAAAEEVVDAQEDAQILSEGVGGAEAGREVLPMLRRCHVPSTPSSR